MRGPCDTHRGPPPPINAGWLAEVVLEDGAFAPLFSAAEQRHNLGLCDRPACVYGWEILHGRISDWREGAPNQTGAKQAMQKDSNQASQGNSKACVTIRFGNCNLVAVTTKSASKMVSVSWSRIPCGVNSSIAAVTTEALPLRIALKKSPRESHPINKHAVYMQ